MTELQINDWQLISKLQWEMVEPGYLTCLAANEKGVNNDTYMLWVTEVPQGFYVSEIPNEIVVEDNITIVCGAPSYEYSPNVLWYYKRQNSDQYKKFENEAVVTFESHSYAHWSKLNFRNISKKNSGIYKCVAEKLGKESKWEEKTIQFNVLGEKNKKKIFTLEIEFLNLKSNRFPSFFFFFLN